MWGISARRLAGCASCVLVSMLPAVSPAEPRWQRASSSHFVFYSAAERDSVLQTARELEDMAEILRMWGLGSRATLRPRVVLIAFPDKESFQPHQPMVGRKRMQVAGYVEHMPFGSWIGYLESDSRGRAVAHHEYAHTLVAEEFVHAPACINEGLAEYLSTFGAGADFVQFGHDLPWHTYVLQSRPLFTTAELFAVEYGSPVFVGGEDQWRFYAESWALIRYLIHNAGGYANLRRFVHDIAEGATPQAAFATSYPRLGWDRLPDQLRRYATDHAEDSRQIGFSSPLDQARVEVHEALRGEAAVQVGLWRSMNTAVAVDETARMLQGAGPALSDLARAAHGTLMFSLAREHEEKGPARLDETVAELRSASAPGVRDGLALSVAGLMMMRCAFLGDTTKREVLLREAGDILDRSLVADSSDARAMAGYAECRIRTGDVTPLVIDRLHRVAPAVPDDPDIQHWRKTY